MARSLSKRTRFDVFKRDQFTCQYCGRKPPAVVLEADHIVAVSAGESSKEHNLLTSCFDCNRGKADGSLDVNPINTKERRKRLEDRIEQTRAYEELLQAQRVAQDTDVDAVIAVYESAFDGWTLFDTARPSIRQFFNCLPRQEVVEAMELACARTNMNRAFRYFCGVCWRKIRGD